MIGASTIQGVSVTGYIESTTEAGGLVGRVARDPNHTDYNRIYDCYVNATVKATSLSTNLINNPSCAGGIVGLIHSNEGNSVAKLDLQRVYFTGKVSSAQMKNNAGNAAGILAITQENHSVRMSEVLCLANEITAHTPNFFYSRRLSNPAYIEHLDKLYVREELKLTYVGDGGVGVKIPAGKVVTIPDADFRTAAFYRENLSWDMDKVWIITEGEYPVLRRGEQVPTHLPYYAADAPYKITASSDGIGIKLAGCFSVDVHDMAGTLTERMDMARDMAFIPASKGVYVVRVSDGLKLYSVKVLVH